MPGHQSAAADHEDYSTPADARHSPPLSCTSTAHSRVLVSSEDNEPEHETGLSSPSQSDNSILAESEDENLYLDSESDFLHELVNMAG